MPTSELTHLGFLDNQIKKLNMNLKSNITNRFMHKTFDSLLVLLLSLGLMVNVALANTCNHREDCLHCDRARLQHTPVAETKSNFHSCGFGAQCTSCDLQKDQTHFSPNYIVSAIRVYNNAESIAR